MALTIFIVPSIWEGDAVWDKLISILKTRYNLPVTLARLISTGQTSADAPRMNDDIAHIKWQLARVVDAADPDGVMALCHSAGGMLGTSAMKDLSVKARSEQGKQGGAKKIVFLTGAIAPEGTVHHLTPFMKIEVFCC
jgi:hypothetical protein